MRKRYGKTEGEKERGGWEMQSTGRAGRKRKRNKHIDGKT